ncbi:hypothetical protein [Alsobacter sp. SYSU BS001988]|jgi:hypothetical protein
MTSHRTNRSRILAAAAAALVAAAIGAPAQARDGQNGALFGGLAAGAVLGGVVANSMNRGPVYREVEAPPPVVYEECRRVRRPLFDEYGAVAGYRTVRVCD